MPAMSHAQDVSRKDFRSTPSMYITAIDPLPLNTYDI